MYILVALQYFQRLCSVMKNNAVFWQSMMIQGLKILLWWFKSNEIKTLVKKHFLKLLETSGLRCSLRPD